MTHTARMISAAQRLAAMGLAIHWLRGPEGGPEQGRGKAPILSGWQKAPFTPADKVSHSYGVAVAEARKRGYPETALNLGVHTGLVEGAALPVVVLDLDSPEALEWAERLPPTSMRTATGKGEHWYYRHPGAGVTLPNKARICGLALDIRGDGGQVVCAPSVHPSGKVYAELAWDPAGVPAFDPAWFPAPERPPPPPRSPSADPGNVRLRAEKWLAALPGAVAGSGGHNAAWEAALGLVKGFGLPESEALALLRHDFNPRCSPPWSERELEHKIRQAASARVPEGYLRDADRPGWKAPPLPRWQERAPEIQTEDPAPVAFGSEDAVLASILKAPWVIDRVSHLLPESFGDGKAPLFAALRTLEETGQPVDIVTLMAQMQRDGAPAAPGYLDSLLALQVDPERIEHHAGQVQEAAALRQIAATAHQAAIEASAGRTPPAQLIERLQERLTSITDRSRQATITTAKEAAHRTIREIEAQYARRDVQAGLSTGMPRIDAVLGRLSMGEMSVIGGRPSHGKSAWADEVGYYNAVTARVPTLVISIEMRIAEVVKRWFCGAGPIDANHMKAAQMTTAEWSAMARVSAFLAEAPLWIDDPSAPTFGQIRAMVRRWRKTVGGDQSLAIIDYFQLIEATSGKRNATRDQELTPVSRGLKALAKDTHTHVMVLAALNREAQKLGRPNKSHLRECGSLEGDADVIILPYRPGADDKRLPQDYTEFIIDKNRNGATDIVTAVWEGHHTRFVDREPMPLPGPEKRRRK